MPSTTVGSSSRTWGPTRSPKYRTPVPKSTGTTLTQISYVFCGDYAGFAQQYLQEDHPGVTALFLTGCGGDQNPYPRSTLELARIHHEVLREVLQDVEQLVGPLFEEDADQPIALCHRRPLGDDDVDPVHFRRARSAHVDRGGGEPLAHVVLLRERSRCKRGHDGGHEERCGHNGRARRPSEAVWLLLHAPH